MRQLLASITAALALAPAVARAQDLSPVPRALINSAALICVKIDGEGRVDAFLLDSKGDAARDKAVLDWVRQLKWPAGEGDGRNRWFPMPVQFGDVPAPAMPAGCSPGSDRT